MTSAADGTVFRSGDDRRGLALAVVYVLAAPALAAGALGLAPAVRWSLAAVCLGAAAVTVASLLRRAARTEVGPAGLVVRRTLRRPVRYPWGGIEAFEPDGDPDAFARGAGAVLMRLCDGGAVPLPGVGGRETRAAAAALSERLARERGRADGGPPPS